MTLFQTLKQTLTAQRMVALATILDGVPLGGKMLVFPDGRVEGALGEFTERVRAAALDLMRAQCSARQAFAGETATADVFIEVYPPAQRLIVVGAVHIAMALATFAKALGFRTIVIDPRNVFASRERFPQVDELVVRFPADALAEMSLDEGCYVVFASHNATFDNPALAETLKHPVRYIGALGSKRTHTKRVAALKEMGLTEADIARIHAPIGLDLGAQGPQEIALSIVAEIIAVKRDKRH